MLLYQRLFDLADCLCAQIETDERPPVCFCGVIPGEAVIADGIDGCADGLCGIAWVRLVSAQHVVGVGVRDERAGNCGSEVGMEVELGILRCYPINEDGSPLSIEEQAAAAEVQFMDTDTICRAVMCCPSLQSKDFIMRGYTPMGPLGGVVGGYWTISMV